MHWFDWTLHVILPLLAFLVGGIPFGYLAGRWYGIDLRRHGSFNIGATNAGRVLGRRIGVAVFLLDCLKGFACVAAIGLVLYLGRPDYADRHPHGAQFAWVLTACCAMLGHIFCPYLGFRGGKGVATALGTALGFYPYFSLAALAAFALWLLVVKFTRYVSLASLAAAAAITPLYAGILWIDGEPASRNLWVLGFSATITLLVFTRHHANIARLLKGTEPTIDDQRAARAAQKQPTEMPKRDAEQRAAG